MILLYTKVAVLIVHVVCHKNNLLLMGFRPQFLNKELTVNIREGEEPLRAEEAFALYHSLSIVLCQGGAIILDCLKNDSI